MDEGIGLHITASIPVIRVAGLHMEVWYMTLPWRWKDQAKMLNHCREIIWRGFQQQEANITAGEPISYDRAYTISAGDFETLAIVAYALDRDLKQCMIYLHVSAEYQEKLLTLDEEKLRYYKDLGSLEELAYDYEGNLIPEDIDREQAVQIVLESYAKGLKGEIVRDEDGVGVSYIDYSMLGTWPLIAGAWCALASGDMPLAKRIAEAPSRESDIEEYPEAEFWYARVLKHCILGTEAEMESHMERLRQAEDFPPFKALGSLYYAIFTGNQQKAQTQLEQYLQWFDQTAKPEWRPIPGSTKSLFVKENDMLLSIPGLAMCRYAEMQGMTLDVDDQYLPKALLLEQPVLDSCAETYIQKALSEYSENEGSEQKRSFLSRLFPWGRG